MIARAELSFRYLLLPLNYPDTVAGKTDRSYCHSKTLQYISPFVNFTLSPHIKFRTVLHMGSQIHFTWDT
jgi:hypothetical protein